MPPKKPPTISKNTDIDSLFAGIDDIPSTTDIDSLFAGIDDIPSTTVTKSSSTPDSKPRASLSADADADEKALLAEIEGLTAEHRAPSRPVTPSLRATAGVNAAARASSESLRKKAAATTTRAAIPSSAAARSAKVESEDEEDDDDDDDEEDDDEEEYDEKTGAIKSKPQSQSQQQQQQQQAGGWWGGLWSTASAAATVAQSTAQSVYKEIQSSEEAQRWTKQVKGSVEGFRELSGELQKRALPTFTTLLHHIAPPISAHERLHIHTTHDLQNYPSLDPIIHHVFSRVMQQVEGGDLLVIQRGSEATNKRNSAVSAGWGGGPWWRDERKRELGTIKGFEAGVKLAKATAEGFANEYALRSPSLEKKEIDPNNPVRKSDIFLCLQPITYPCPFTTITSKHNEDNDDEDPSTVEEVLSFAIYLFDPKHSLEFTTMSQTCPAKWGEWMDAEFEELPEDVQLGLANGAVDPREWIAEWMEETIALAVGITAQRYVSKRMGVGEGLGKGKQVDLEGRQEVDLGGEAGVL